MRISTRILAGTVAVALVCVIFLSVIVGLLYQNMQHTQQLIFESEPAFDAIEHLLLAVHEDNMLVQEYLIITEYDQAAEYDNLLQISSDRCEQLTESVDDQIVTESITDQEVINTYRMAVIIYGSLQRARDSLLDLHKRELANNKDFYYDKVELQQRYQSLLGSTTDELTSSLTSLRERNNQLQRKLIVRNNQIFQLLAAVLILFIVAAIISAYWLITRLGKPIDHMRRTMRSFVAGDYTARATRKSSVIEIQELQDKLNAVFRVVETRAQQGSDGKVEVRSQLLPQKYAQILSYIKAQAANGMSVTFTDVKKQFSLTHPTVQSRIRYLEGQELVRIVKIGRQKTIHLR